MKTLNTILNRTFLNANFMFDVIKFSFIALMAFGLLCVLFQLAFNPGAINNASFGGF